VFQLILSARKSSVLLSKWIVWWAADCFTGSGEKWNRNSESDGLLKDTRGTWKKSKRIRKTSHEWHATNRIQRRISQASRGSQPIEETKEGWLFRVRISNRTPYDILSSIRTKAVPFRITSFTFTFVWIELTIQQRDFQVWNYGMTWSHDSPQLPTIANHNEGPCGTSGIPQSRAFDRGLMCETRMSPLVESAGRRITDWVFVLRGCDHMSIQNYVLQCRASAWNFGMK
jgi:hypothetical protein